MVILLQANRLSADGMLAFYVSSTGLHRQIHSPTAVCNGRSTTRHCAAHLVQTVSAGMCWVFTYKVLLQEALMKIGEAMAKSGQDGGDQGPQGGAQGGAQGQSGEQYDAEEKAANK